MSTKVLLRLIPLAVLLSVSAFAVDGTVLVNQSTVMAAGGFPYKITQPGTYKLSGNLVVSAAVTGIEIDADNVTVDLNGFTITDPSGTAISNGLAANGFPLAHPGLIVMNGTIVALNGIFNLDASLDGLNATIYPTVVHDVSIRTSVGGDGIFIESGRITNCTITSGFSPVGANGIYIQDGGLVSGNTVSNYTTGIGGNNNSITNNVILGNTTGLFGGGTTGYGSNAFIRNATDTSFGTSMKNNVCSNGNVC